MSSPVYEQDTVVPSTEEAERVLPTVLVLGQASAQSSSRTLAVNAQAEESSDNTEMITAAERIMMMGVGDRAPGEVRDW